MATTDFMIEGILLIITVSGDLTANEMIAIIREYYSNGIIKDVIWDLNLGTLQSITKDGFESIANVTKEAFACGSRHDGKTVFIGNATIEYDLLRMYSVISAITGVSVEYNVFKTLEEAGEFIEGYGVSQPPFLL